MQPSFQSRVAVWIHQCFGPAIAADKEERNHRFLEEALEVVQAGGCTASEAHQLVDYVFNRPVGDLAQEVGGAMNTLAALCNSHNVDLNSAADTELARVWAKSDEIRAKQAAKPKHSPLPAAPAVAAVTETQTADSGPGWMIRERHQRNEAVRNALHHIGIDPIHLRDYLAGLN